MNRHLLIDGKISPFNINSLKVTKRTEFIELSDEESALVGKAYDYGFVLDKNFEKTELSKDELADFNRRFLEHPLLLAQLKKRSTSQASEKTNLLDELGNLAKVKNSNTKTQKSFQ